MRDTVGKNWKRIEALTGRLAPSRAAALKELLERLFAEEYSAGVAVGCDFTVVDPDSPEADARYDDFAQEFLLAIAEAGVDNLSQYRCGVDGETEDES